MGTNHALSFLFHLDVSRIFGNFTSLFGIRIAFYAPDGTELLVGEDRSPCCYCTAIRACPGGMLACLEQDREARHEAFRVKTLVSYVCHGGLLEAVKPMLQDGIAIGYAMIGQIRIHEHMPIIWKQRLMKSSEMPESELLQQYTSLPLRSTSDLQSILEMFSDLVDLILARNLIRRPPMDKITNLVLHMREYPTVHLTITEAADQACMSSSRLTHVCKERYGLSFTALQKQIMFEHARFLLENLPELTIKEIAAKLGFEDQRYFSRQFSRMYGISPQSYRNQPIRPHSQPHGAFHQNQHARYAGTVMEVLHEETNT